MDKFRIDSHKLLYHVPRVQDWLEGKTVYPIYMETSPSGVCNHRCQFCALDFMEYQPRYLDWPIFKERLEELGRLGLKSMMHAGEGEPLLHPHLADMVRVGKACGIDQAVTTNGVLLTPDKAADILPCAEWIRISCNAGTRDTYAAIHRTRPKDFDAVVDNLRQAAAIRRARNLECTLGVQILLLPENRGEIETLARLVRDLGLDYLIVKPYSHHPSSHTLRYKKIDYSGDLALAETLEALNTPEFQVVFRVHAMRKWNEAEHPYTRCLALPFWSYIDAGGNVWGCSVFLGDDRFLYGNIHENTFQEIWEGERRRTSLAWVEQELDACQCRVNCRMDEINRYLWDLRHPPAHVNFI
jgi:MoaA/NifB/PqqE/SkfB family radical SAM enzyme